MNYLAHILLSGDDPAWKVGGFLGDFIKGPIEENSADPVIKGALLHRKIDRFVDQQPEFQQTLTYFEAPYRRYAGILIDMMYDHFLASNWQRFHSENLSTYCQEFYQELNNNFHQLPENAHFFAHVAAKSEWLEGYANFENMPRYLQGISRRFRKPFSLEDAQPLLDANYQLLFESFNLIFPKLVDFSSTQITHMKR